MLRKLDHSAIYLLIAGTYTPFALVAIEGAWGWTLFGVAWFLAIFGIIAKFTIGFRFPRLSLALYLGMGWMSVIAIKPMIESLTTSQLMWILAGGLLYTAGTPFYAWKSKRYTRRVAPVRARRRGLSLRGGAERGQHPHGLTTSSGAPALSSSPASSRTSSGLFGPPT